MQNNYPAIIQKVHNDFFEASTRILAEAKEISSQFDKNKVNKGKRLNNIGFKQTEDVKYFGNAKEVLKEQKYKAELVFKYSEQYPFYKFITIDEVNKLCKKYNLVCGEISRFTGFVPEKNLEAIEQFNKNHGDEMNVLVRITEAKFYTGDDEDSPNVKGARAVKKILEENNYILDVHSNEASRQTVHNRIYAMGRANGNISINSIKYEPYSGFEICAPKSDFNMNGLKQIGNFLSKAMKMNYEEVKDPIVLRRVEGGFLIVTAWGDEASDPIVVNEKMN